MQVGAPREMEAHPLRITPRIICQRASTMESSTACASAAPVYACSKIPSRATPAPTGFYLRQTLRYIPCELRLEASSNNSCGDFEEREKLPRALPCDPRGTSLAAQSAMLGHQRAMAIDLPPRARVPADVKRFTARSLCRSPCVSHSKCSEE